MPSSSATDGTRRRAFRFIDRFCSKECREHFHTDSDAYRERKRKAQKVVPQEQETVNRGRTSDLRKDGNRMARGKDGLYRRNGIFCFRYKDADVWREKSTGERDREQARKVKKDFEKSLEARELPNEMSKQTVVQACTRWVAQHQTSGLKGGLKSSHGRKCEASYLRQLVRRLGNRKLKSITLDTLKDYQTSRQTG